MHIPTFKIPTIRHVWQLIQQGDFAYVIDLKGTYLHICSVKCHHHFLCFVWQNILYQWKVVPFGQGTTPRVFTSLTMLILFLFQCKGFHIIIYVDDILVLICCKHVGKRA